MPDDYICISNNNDHPTMDQVDKNEGEKDDTNIAVVSARSSSEHNPPNSVQTNGTKIATTENNDDNNTQQDGWQDLMGTDVRMKVIDSDSSTDSETKERTHVQPKDAVVVDFVGREASSIDVDDDDCPIFHVAKDWLIIVTEKDVIPGLELAIRFMNVGETAIVWCHSKYAYGPSQRTSNGETSYTLPPYSHVRYQVTVKAVIPDPERDTPTFHIRSSLAKKMIGNDCYAHEWSDGHGKQKAIQLYKRGVDAIEYLVNEEGKEESNTYDPDVIEQAKSILLDCLNNIVAVHMRAKEYHKAKEAAVHVLQYDPRNTKALIRAAKACLLHPGSSYEEVQAAIDAAAEGIQELSTSNPDLDHTDDLKEINKLRSELKRKRAEYKKKSKDMASRMVKDIQPSGATATESGTKTKSLNSSDEDERGIGNKIDDDETAVKGEEDSERQHSTNWKYFLFQLVFQMLVALIIGYVTRHYQGISSISSATPSAVHDTTEQQQPSNSNPVNPNDEF